MRRNPERLAWTVLWTAFVAFWVAAIGCPWLAISYVRNARQPLPALVSAQRGTVLVDRKGSNRPDAINLDTPAPLELFKGDGMRTDRLAEGLLTLHLSGDQENPETLSTVVVYDNSDVVLKDAYTPRFGFGSGSHKAVLQINSGRVRIEVLPADDQRAAQVDVHTDHTRIHLSEGSYALEVTNQQTTVTVRSGRANVRSGGQELELSDQERAVVPLEGPPEGPLSAEIDFIVNGDFDQAIDNGWIVNPSDPSTRIFSENDDEQTVVRFQHDEPQPAEVGLVQTLNRNVRDLETLVLHLKVRVNYHSLSVCGTQGSECPVMVRINYRDAGDGLRHWVHGFYTFEDPGQVGQLPYYCESCPDPRVNHDRVTEGAWFLYESPNLMDVLQEFQPVTIDSIRIYASGHSYDSMVTDVELLAQE